jgi:hypothetical protein
VSERVGRGGKRRGLVCWLRKVCKEGRKEEKREKGNEGKGRYL